MGYAVLAAIVLAVGSPLAAAQASSSTLHITVTITDAAGASVPVARHALLISDEPPQAPPRRVVTTLAGTADVSLRPGRYAVESDQPVTIAGKTYEWSQRIDIVAGRDSTLALTIDNASIETRAPAATTPSVADASIIASQAQDALVGLWTPAAYASGFVVDSRGLILTSQRAIGAATSAEAQFTPDIKVKALVLASDPARDVAVLWVNPAVVASVRPLSPGCGQPKAPVTNDTELSTLGAAMTGEKRLSLGEVTGVGPRVLLSDLRLASGDAGGPVFTATALIGLTTRDDREPDDRSDARVVRIDQACEVIAAAEKKMTDANRPDATHLPLDPRQPLAPAALSAAMRSRAGNLSPYLMSTRDFDLAFITPLHGTADQARRDVMDFGNWSQYLADYPRVLVIRATPKLVEGVWAKMARGAAMTQGMSLPAMKHSKSGFARMRAFCGESEVAPIHPFTLEHRVSDTEAITEGLYVFDPGSLGPQCGTVKLMLYSEAEPDKADTRVVDPKVLQQIARDFAAL